MGAFNPIYGTLYQSEIASVRFLNWTTVRFTATAVELAGWLQRAMSSNHILLKYLLSLQSWPEEECVVHLKIAVCSFIQRTSSLAATCKEMSFRAESWRHASCHRGAGDSCSARELPVIHLHMCKVQHGGFELLNIMGWARQLSKAQSSTQTSAQRMTGNLTETQQTKQQLHARTCSWFLISLLPWRALETPRQGCSSRAKIGCTKNLPQELTVGSFPVCWSPAT